MSRLWRPRDLATLVGSAGLGISLGSALRRQTLAHRNAIVACDSREPKLKSRQPDRPAPASSSSTSLIAQASTGSLAGFAAGLAVAHFSRLLAIVLSVVILSVQALSSTGVDLTHWMMAEARSRHRVLIEKCGSRPVFTVAFATTSMLAGFAHF